MTDPTLKLTYNFQPSLDWDLNPGEIIVSIDPQNTVSNTLRFSIRNPADQPVLNFTNNDDLKPGSDLPPHLSRASLAETARPALPALSLV